MNLQAYIALGWSPIFAVVSNGSGGQVLQVTAWTGGNGSAPVNGQYIGASGFVSTAASAVNIAGSGGGGGSVTSANFVSLRSVVQANSAQMTSADNALSQSISVVSQALSVETAARIAAVDIVSNAVSIVSQALSVETAARIAADNSLSGKIDTVSNAVSIVSQALSVETAARIAAVNTVSNAVSIVSQALSVETAARIAAINTVSNAVSIVSQALSVETANRVSAINVVSNAVSIVSQALSVETANRVSAVNVVSNSLSVETAARIAADNTISNAVSIVSAAAALKNPIITIQNVGSNTKSSPTNINFFGNAVSTFLSGTNVKINISVTPGATSVTSAKLADVKSAVIANSAQMTSADNALSQGISVVSQALSVETAARIAAINTVSNAVSIVSAAAALKNPIINIQNQGSALTSSPTTFNFSGTAVSTFLSGTVVEVKITGGGGSGSVTSADFVSLRGLVQSNSAQMTSANNAISNAVSIVSVALAAEISNRISSNYLPSNSQTTNYTLTAGDVNVGIIMTSTGALQIVIPEQSAVNIPIGAQIPLFQGGAGAITISAANASVTISGPLLTGGKDSNVVLWKTGTNTWRVAGNTVSVTSQRFSVLSAKVVTHSQTLSVHSQAISVLSQQVSALSQSLSVTKSVVAVNSADVTSLKNVVSIISQQVSAISAGLGGMQMKVVQGIQGLSASAFTNISGLSASVTSGAVYQLQGMVMYKTSGTNGPIAFTLTFPGVTVAKGIMEGDISVGNIGLSTVEGVIAYFDETASGSAIFSVTPASNNTLMVKLDALFTTSTVAGTVQWQAKTSGTGNPINIQKGSFLRAYKIL